MPEAFIVGRGNPTEAAIMRVIGHMHDGWSTKALAERLGKEQGRISRWLTELAKTGAVVHVGAGRLSRWCTPENAKATRDAVGHAASETTKRRRLASKLYQKSHPRRKATAPYEPAFTIPPRNVPCSVWALGEMS